MTMETQSTPRPDILCHIETEISGPVEDTAVHPDGKQLVRIQDHWFFRDDCDAVCVAI